MVPNPKLVPFELSGDERRVLEGWAQRRKTAQALALRSRIVLLCAGGASNHAVAAELGISRDTVAKWRSRFLARRLQGLTDEPRPGRPRTVSDEKVEQVVTAALEQAPAGRGHALVHAVDGQAVAGVAVHGVADLADLRAEASRDQTWKLSTDPQFIDKVRDVVGLYMAPPEHALVLCVDEKSQIQALTALPRSCRCCPRPDRASYQTAVDSAQATVTQPRRVITGTADLAGAIGRAVLASLNPPRRPRVCARWVKSPLSRWNKHPPGKPAPACGSPRSPP